MYYVKTTISKRVNAHYCATVPISIGPFPTITDASIFCNGRNIDTQEQNIIATVPQSKIIIKPTQIRQ